MALVQKILSFVLLFSLSAASPLSHASLNQRHSTTSTPDLSSLVLPSSSLPPATGLKLKHVALGIGTQNYTCPTTTTSNGTVSAAAASATPSSFGALASLYDIGPFLATPIGRAFQGVLPPLALAMYGALSQGDHSGVWASIVAQMPGDVLSSAHFGEHFFAEVAATLTPTWALTPSTAMYPDDAASILFQGKKTNSSDAPANACPGLTGEGAVPWLYLTKAASSDGEITAVYRVVTAGGMQPDTCTGQAENVEVKYAAEYWFYGPADKC